MPTDLFESAIVSILNEADLYASRVHSREQALSEFRSIAMELYLAEPADRDFWRALREESQ